MTDVIYREAVRADLPAVIALLADDVLGKARDFTEVDEAYERAFADISADPRNQLIVAEQGGELVGCFQITYIPGLGRLAADARLRARHATATLHCPAATAIAACPTTPHPAPPPKPTCVKNVMSPRPTARATSTSRYGSSV